MNAQARQPPAEKKEPRPGGGEVFGVGGLPTAPKSVVFVIDGSAALSDVAHHVKQRVVNGIRRLYGKQTFNVVWFGGGKPHSVFADLTPISEESRKAATEAVERIQFAGGKNPVPAFAVAFALKPELVYLVSDGNFDAADVERIAATRPKDTKVSGIAYLFADAPGKDNFAKMVSGPGRTMHIDAARLIRLDKEGPPEGPRDAADAKADVGGYAGVPSIVFLVDQSRVMAQVANLALNSVTHLLGTLPDGAMANVAFFDDDRVGSVRPGVWPPLEPEDKERIVRYFPNVRFASTSDLRLPLKDEWRFTFRGDADKLRAVDRICILTATDIEPAWIETITAGNKHKIPLDVIAFVLPGSKGHPNLRKLCEANGGKFREVVAPKPTAAPAK